MMTGLGLDLPMGNYLGYLDGRPVASSNLFLRAGLAGVQFVATLAEGCGQGLAGAMSLAPLLEARQMGYRIGMLLGTSRRPGRCRARPGGGAPGSSGQ
ncbi:MAG: hypothetical protein K6U89_11360 [Chloroflexi bacterium]|nr:hypothetical protein [Chloroflexota bacterium]